MILYTLTGTPLVRPTFYGRNVAFQEGLPLVRDRNDYIFVKIYIVKWPFQSLCYLDRVVCQETSLFTYSHTLMFLWFLLCMC